MVSLLGNERKCSSLGKCADLALPQIGTSFLADIPISFVESCLVSTCYYIYVGVVNDVVRVETISLPDVINT